MVIFERKELSVISLSRTLSAATMAALLISAASCRKATEATARTAQTAQPAATTGSAPSQPAKPVPAQLPDVLARVNGQDVTRAEFEHLIKNMEASQGQQVPAERRDEVYRGALDQLVTYTVLTQELKARSIAVPDTEIDEFIRGIRQQFKDDASFKKALAERGTTEQKLREDARTNMGVNKLVETEIASVQPATEAESRDFYQKNPKEFEQPEAVRASHILIRADENADAAAKQKARVEAEAVLKKAKAGEDFAQLAKQHSADGSAQQGGDLNFFPRGQMVPAFDQAAFALPTGQISGIVETQFGYHIIKVTDRRAASVMPFEQVDQQIRQYLTEKNKKTRADSFVEELKKKARIEVLI